MQGTKLGREAVDWKPGEANRATLVKLIVGKVRIVGAGGYRASKLFEGIGCSSVYGKADNRSATMRKWHGKPSILGKAIRSRSFCLGELSVCQ